jgi:hypothetical protein
LLASSSSLKLKTNIFGNLQFTSAADVVKAKDYELIKSSYYETKAENDRLMEENKQIKEDNFNF